MRDAVIAKRTNKKPRALYVRTQKKPHRFKNAGVFFCPKCKIVLREDAADRCACPRRCDTCDVECSRPYMLQCDACRVKARRARDQERVDRAIKYTVETLPKDAYLYDNNEHWYSDFQEVIDDLSESFWDDPEQTITLWVADECRTPHINFDRIVDGLRDHLENNEDSEVGDFCNGLDELQQSIKAWNEKQKPSVHHINYKACIVLTAADFPPDPDAKETAA